jgi:predicted GNAT superfamily acetyltransferase
VEQDRLEHVEHSMSRATRRSAELTPTASVAGVQIRLLHSIDDCQACVELQREIWGWEQADVVPATLLHVVEYVGGIAAGAFAGDGTLMGFVFGVSGVRDGELAHWSHMLGVRESARNLGLGRMLKEYQRRTLAELGIRRIFWSFDPLMAKNAYFNLNRLGAAVVDYVPDMYGTTASPLHLGVATDRLVVAVETSHAAATPEDHSLEARAGTPILSVFPRLDDVTISIGDPPRTPPAVLIEIPTDVLDTMTRSPSTVQTWRLSVRDHFQWAMARGYHARGVVRNAQGRAFYLMER